MNGHTSENHFSRPVALNTNTTPEVMKPAEVVSVIENLRDMATAAIAYILISIRSGCERRIDRTLPSSAAPAKESQTQFL